MKTYRQYCPIARASEVLAQRWTPIIIRELLNGPATYTALADAAPGIPRSLLTSRLRDLQRLELVASIPANGTRRTYQLTDAGEDLAPVLDALGRWGNTWLEIAPEHADPGYLLNAWCTAYLNHETLPPHRIVIRFDFTDQPRKATPLWMIIDGPNSEVCRTDPGHGDDLTVTAESVAVAEWHLGHLEWHDALRSNRVTVVGPRDLAKALPTWNRRSRWRDTEDL